MDIDTTPKSGASAMVPVAIGLVGLVFSIAALYFALSNGSAADASNKRIAALESSISDISAKADAATAQAKGVDSKLTTIAQGEQSDISTVYTKVGSALTDRDKAITELQQKIGEMSSGGRASATASSGGGKESAGPSGPGGTYTIASGDTFATLAKKFGVSVTALVNANPNANPSRLQIGQKVNIPGKAESTPKTAPAAGSAAPAAAQ